MCVRKYINKKIYIGLFENNYWQIAQSQFYSHLRIFEIIYEKSAILEKKT